AALDAEQHISRLDGLAHQNSVQSNKAYCGTCEVEAFDHVLELRRLAPGYGDPGYFRAVVQSDGNLFENFSFDLFDSKVIHHRNRGCPDANDVVHVHCYAIDADGIVLAEHMRDHRLRADTIGRNRNPLAAYVDDIGE